MSNVVQPDNLTNARTGMPNRNAMLPYLPNLEHDSAMTNFFSASYPLMFTPIGAATTTPNNAVTSAGQEAVVLTLGRTMHSVQVSGTFIATVSVEATNDITMTNWKQVDTFSTADVKQYGGVYYALRFRITSYTSGSVIVNAISQR